MYLCRSSSNVLRMPSFLKCFKIHRFPLRLPHKMMLERPTVVRTCGVLTILRLKRASRQSCVRFQLLTSQKGSEPEVFLTAACTFWTSQLPRVLRHSGVLLILTSKCALHHNRVRSFEISSSKSDPRPRCFWALGFETRFASQRRALFDLSPPDASAPAALASFVSRLFYLFARLDLLSSDSFSSLLLLPLFSHHCNCICP